MVVAVALLASVIALFAVAFTTGMFSSHDSQLNDVAVTLADSALDNARAASPVSTLLSGSAVSNAPAQVDLSATSSPVQQSQKTTTLDSTVFTTTVFTGGCYLQSNGQCTLTSNGSSMIRVIADVTWNASSGCPSGGCYYVASSLVSNGTDPVLDINPTVPGSPTQTTPAAGNGQVTINWTDPTTNGGSAITGYDVYVGKTSGGENYGSVACAAIASATSCVVGSLTNSTTYYFTVEAVNAEGNSAPSNEESAVPQAVITLSPTTGPVGTVVTISGTGFTAGGTINHSSGVTFDGTNVSIGAANVTVASNGTWSATFTVPNAANGSQTVTATDSSGVNASTTYSVTAAVTLSPTSGPVGTSVTVSGTGYTAGGTINHSSGVTIDGTNVSIGASNVTVGANGTWSASFTVPSVPYGAQTVTATDSSSVWASTVFDVAAITLSPTSGTVGTSVTISGSGFTPGGTISQTTGVTFGGSDVTLNASQTVSSTGTWSATFTVPNASHGSQAVTATDSSGVSTSTTFSVTAAVTLSPTVGTVGTSVTISGTGFSGGGSISHSTGVTFEGTDVSIGA
ncbi:MAG TPA: IPT/TIG domain-containing protein, partial [Acidimicrobiales bacterium]|nr:IPT/TIG domain-containing protein [Acidimicrobiales bacterium]